ncbi:hypothetical protein CMEL01_08287, partial [Colletotrichum melonis]
LPPADLRISTYRVEKCQQRRPKKCRKEERKTKKKEAEGWHGLPSESESPPSSSNRHDSISDSNSNSNGRRRSTKPNLDFEAQLLLSSSSRLPLANLSKSIASCMYHVWGAPGTAPRSHTDTCPDTERSGNQIHGDWLSHL